MPRSGRSTGRTSSARFSTAGAGALTDILGFDINGMTFLSTAVEAKLHDLDGTIEDVARLRVPLVYFCAERDTWVSYDEVRRVFAGSPQCTLVPIKGAMHEVRENPRAADEVFQQVVWACREAGPFPAGGVKLQAPDNRLVLAQNRRERERLKRVEPATEPESEFWANYLDQVQPAGEVQRLPGLSRARRAAVRRPAGGGARARRRLRQRALRPVGAAGGARTAAGRWPCCRRSMWGWT